MHFIFTICHVSKNTEKLVRLPAELNVVVNKLSMHKTHLNRLIDTTTLMHNKAHFQQVLEDFLN